MPETRLRVLFVLSVESRRYLLFPGIHRKYRSGARYSKFRSAASALLRLKMERESATKRIHPARSSVCTFKKINFKTHAKTFICSSPKITLYIVVNLIHLLFGIKNLYITYIRVQLRSEFYILFCER